jgi:hypothetical protein
MKTEKCPASESYDVLIWDDGKCPKYHDYRRGVDIKMFYVPVVVSL